MADRYSERGAQRWEDNDRRGRGRDYGDGERGFLERFADEVRSWFGDEEAQRRRMRDEREEWHGERRDWSRAEWGRSGDWGRGDWGRGAWGRGDWARGDWGRSGRGDWMRGPDERDWSRDWGYVEGRGQGSGRGFGGGEYGTRGYGGYGTWGQRDWDRDRREAQEFGWGRTEDASRGERDWRTGAYTGRGPRGFQRSDERIREDVCERMTQHSFLDPSDIEVRVQNGEVTLDGSVNDRWAKRTAEDLAESVWGVRGVHNQIRVVQMDLGREPHATREEQGRTGPQRGTWAA
jgi:osmotically-inducible protein OsmY